MASIQDYFTTPQANAGVKVELSCGEWVHICGEDSTEYQQYILELQRRVFSMSDADKKTTDPRQEQYRVANILIKKWSFDEKVTADNINKLIDNAPSIWQEIQQAAFDRSLFIKKKSPTSSVLQSNISDSKAKTKVRKPRKSKT